MMKPRSANILFRRLTQWGHEVVTAHDAEAALEEMAKAPGPDRVLRCDHAAPRRRVAREGNPRALARAP